MKNKTKVDKFNWLQLKKLGARFKLSLSSYVALGNKIIGVDVLERKLLIAEKIDGLFHPYLIELSKVSVITTKKIYNSIKAGELKKRRIEEFLQSIFLQLELRNGEDTITLPFYERSKDDIHKLHWLESKARNWQMMLSKMLR